MMAHMIFGDLALNEANKENLKPDFNCKNRISHLSESPPTLSETTPEKSVKNFST